MDCPFCGVKLPENVVVCPVCGEEIQVISAVDALEDEILREFVDEDSKPKETAANETSGTSREKKKKPKHRKRRAAILVVIVAAVIAASVFGGVTYRRNHSPEYLLAKAQEEYAREEYDRALRSLDRLLALDGDNEEGLLLEGYVYAVLGDYDSAERSLLDAIAIDPGSADAYRALLEIYAVQGKKDEILRLKSTVTDGEILALFDDYLTPEPEILTKGGSYEDSLTVEISAPKNGLSIYYTLDGSDPAAHGILYKEPVKIDEQGSTVLTAVCADDEGEFSEPVSETYIVTFTPPDMPEADPDGGQFSYSQTVTVSAPEGTTVYYTWDGTTPDEDSSVYSSPIAIPEGNHVLSLIAVDERGIYSEVLRCNYIYYPQTYSQTIDASSTNAQAGGQEDTDSIEGGDLILRNEQEESAAEAGGTEEEETEWDMDEEEIRDYSGTSGDTAGSENGQEETAAEEQSKPAGASEQDSGDESD